MFILLRSKKKRLYKLIATSSIALKNMAIPSHIADTHYEYIVENFLAAGLNVNVQLNDKQCITAMEYYESKRVDYQDQKKKAMSEQQPPPPPKQVLEPQPKQVLEPQPKQSLIMIKKEEDDSLFD